jgi:SpoVK/Ycf46/Vps4 family AAA+-type ATPase
MQKQITSKDRTAKQISSRLQLPFLTAIPQEQLRHHIILPTAVEQRFQRIEREYAARDRLAHHGFNYKQKILLYGQKGCGKTMSAERLAWNTGLKMLKVRFNTMVSFDKNKTATNFRIVFSVASKNPCLLFLDECDFLVKSFEDDNKVEDAIVELNSPIRKDAGLPIKESPIVVCSDQEQAVNIFLQILDEYHPRNGLLVAATNLDKSLNMAVWCRFDEAIKVPKPTATELEALLKQTLITMDKGSIDWHSIVLQMQGFSASLAVQVAQNAAKSAILDQEELVSKHFYAAILEIN